MVERVPSLRARLVATMALLFLAGMVVMYLAVRAYGQRAADLSYDRLLTGSALSIAETLSVDGAHVRVDLPYAALDSLRWMVAASCSSPTRRATCCTCWTPPR